MPIVSSISCFALICRPALSGMKFSITFYAWIELGRPRNEYNSALGSRRKLLSTNATLARAY